MIVRTVLVGLSLLSGTTSFIYTCNTQASCGCSKTSTVIVSKIIGGEPVINPHSWGWIASLRSNGFHICGASIVSEWYVITAAHCIESSELISKLTLHFGINQLSNIGLMRTVDQVTIHPLYDQDLFTNDLAILRLNASLSLTDPTISRICLPTANVFDDQSPEYPPINQSVVAIGWGITDVSGRVPSPILQQVTLQALARTNPACTNSINDEILQFCAGVQGGEKDTCRGDSGGPLMMFNNDQWQLVGVTSYGINCALEGFAGVYTRIAYYSSYIQQIINLNSTNFSSIIAANIPQSSIFNQQSHNNGSLSRISIVLVYLACKFVLGTRLLCAN